MENNLTYIAYLEKCKKNGSSPLAYNIWLGNKESDLKTTDFRQGQKMEIGFDLDERFTGKFTTSEGENLS